MAKRIPAHRRLAAWAVTGPPGRAIAMTVDLAAMAVIYSRFRRRQRAKRQSGAN